MTGGDGSFRIPNRKKNFDKDSKMPARWFIATVILGLSFGGAYWAGLYARKWREAEQPEAVAEGLMIPVANLDIGEVWEEKGFVWQLPIRNLTSDTIQVQQFKTSCGCTSVNPSKLLLQPGETATVALTIDLTHRSSTEEGLSRRPFALSIQPVTLRSRRDGSGWQLHGAIRSRVTLDAKNVHFGEQPIHGQPAVRRELLATVHIPCRDLEVAVDSLVASAIVKRRADDSTRFEITIAANPELPPGSFKAEAKIHVVEPSGERELACTLPIVGEMQPEVRLLPARVLLETRSIGETAEAVVTLQAPPDANVAVDHIEIDDPGLRVEPAAIEGIPSGRAYRLRQQVAKEGEQRSTARFIIRKLNSKPITLPVEIWYRGKQAKKNAAPKMTESQP